MALFQASGFSVELPAGTADASSYCFAFPGAGDFAPNLTIQFQHRTDVPDLAAETERIQGVMRASLEDYVLLSEGTYRRGTWQYNMAVSEWGPGSGRIRQLQMLLYVPDGLPTLYTVTATDFAGNFPVSEPLFRQILGSFQHNGVQCLAALTANGTRSAAGV